jgi:hypothetical protein
MAAKCGPGKLSEAIGHMDIYYADNRIDGAISGHSTAVNQPGRRFCGT